MSPIAAGTYSLIAILACTATVAAIAAWFTWRDRYWFGVSDATRSASRMALVALAAAFLAAYSYHNCAAC